MFDPATVRFRGPLVPHVGGFWAELMRLRYAPFSGANLLRLAAHVSRWLDDRSLQVGDLTDERVASFFAHRRRRGHTQFRSPRALRPLLSYLRERGLAPPSSPVRCETAVERFVLAYAAYLRRERGLGLSTIRAYADFAEQFAATVPDLDWARLTAGEVTRFILRVSRRSSIGHCKHKAARPVVG
jgi:hypothetical protein